MYAYQGDGEVRMQYNMQHVFTSETWAFNIDFKKLEADVKAKKWTFLLNNLSEKDAHILAEHYDFSGGQIENIARIRAIDYVLNGKFAMLQEHEIYSKAETLDRKGSRARNGFNVWNTLNQKTENRYWKSGYRTCMDPLFRVEKLMENGLGDPLLAL